MVMNTAKDDILNNFAEELVRESGLPIEEGQRRRLVEVIRERIDTRLFLELLAMLTPEQAERVQADIGREDGGEPQRLASSLAREIPDYSAKVVVALSRIHDELAADLVSLAGSATSRQTK